MGGSRPRRRPAAGLIARAAGVIKLARKRLCAVGGRLRCGICGPVMAVAFRRGHDTVGCQGAVPA